MNLPKISQKRHQTLQIPAKGSASKEARKLLSLWNTHGRAPRSSHLPFAKYWINGKVWSKSRHKECLTETKTGAELLPAVGFSANYCRHYCVFVRNATQVERDRRQIGQALNCSRLRTALAVLYISRLFYLSCQEDHNPHLIFKNETSRTILVPAYKHTPGDSILCFVFLL